MLCIVGIALTHCTSGLVAKPKPLLTQFSIHHRLAGCVNHTSILGAIEGKTAKVNLKQETAALKLEQLKKYELRLETVFS